MSGRMNGKKVLVVGAGQQPGGAKGNGRAIAELLGAEGAEVCAVDIVHARAEETVKEITLDGGLAHAISADVASSSDCKRLVDEAWALMGRIDVLVNNVGLNTGDGDAFTLDDTDWQRLMDVNLRSMWLTARAAIAVMRDQRSGAIVNISSIASRMGGRLFAYSISKAGVEALTHSLAVDVAPWGIRCNCVILGRIDTPHAVEGHHWNGDPDGLTREEVVARSGQFVPLGRIGSASDVAFAVLFLSSDEAGYITGVNLPVDGGSLAVVGTYGQVEANLGKKS
jgi:NAD(P)-dependent dehydrogenase (short-subunit alcohol dehydrogenase family)